ncbi:MAG: D-aminoacyl-tRNA deacylase [Bacilli bacterium]
MRILVQVVEKAEVEVGGKKVSGIGRGFLAFVGFTSGDDEETGKKMIGKMLKMRVFSDPQGKTNLSLSDVGGNILAVSQFTLYADMRKGNRPSFEKALGREQSQPLYELFRKNLLAAVPDAGFGIFGADMEVNLVNDGPFTVLLDSKELF